MELKRINGNIIDEKTREGQDDQAFKVGDFFGFFNCLNLCWFVTLKT